MNRSANPAINGALVDLLPRTLLRDTTLVVGLAVALTLGARIALPLPFTPVPVTAQTFVVLGGAVVLGASRAVMGSSLYLLAGLTGVPLFATGGATLGYVIGFIAAAAVVGAIADRGAARRPAGVIAAMVVGNLIIYMFGVPYLAVYMGMSLGAAVEAGVMPFLIGDAVKVALASGLVPIAWKHAGGRWIGGEV